MLLPPFKLEEYFAKHEFIAPYTLGSSDPETHSLSELISMADTECLSLWNNLKFSYTETHGLSLLRQEISHLYKIQKPENILVFSGAEEVIFVTLQVLLKPADHVVLITPCYQSLREIPKAAGAKITEFSLDWKNNAWSFDIDKFSTVVTDNTKLVILNFPHNPTGFLPNQDQFKSIIEIISRKNAYLFSDEVYRFSEKNSADCLPAAVDYYEKGLSLGVMSKSFGLPGLRIGWIATQDSVLLQEFARFKNYTTICNNAPGEILALIAIRNRLAILARNISITQKNLDLLEIFFQKHQHIYEWYRPRAGFINFPRLKLDISIDVFTDQLIQEQGVIILPGSLFDNTNNHFRLGFGRKNLPEALSRLEIFTQKL